MSDANGGLEKEVENQLKPSIYGRPSIFIDRDFEKVTVSPAGLREVSRWLETLKLNRGIKEPGIEVEVSTVDIRIGSSSIRTVMFKDTESDSCVLAQNKL